MASLAQKSKRLLARCAPFLISAIGGLSMAVGTVENRVVLPRIMPLGDSITEGDFRRDSYRWYLWRLLHSAGFRVDFVGSVQPDAHGPPIPPEDDFDTDYEGHSGWSTLDLLNGIDAALMVNPPDIVLLHIGTNDIIQCWSVTQSAETIRQIIEIIHKHNPRIVVLVAKLIPAGDAAALGSDRYCGDGKTMDGRIQELNKLIDGIILDQPQTISVDLHSALDPRVDLSDGIHPNESGQKKMARAWFDALRPLLTAR
jgi:acyl-CoA thioesterase I